MAAKHLQAETQQEYTGIEVVADACSTLMIA